MKPFLVNTPDLSIFNPPAANKYISLVAASGAIASVIPVIVTDATVMVDNYPSVTSITLMVVINQGSSSVTDVVNIKGSSVYSTANNQKFILLGDVIQSEGKQVTATIISCGQTSTLVD